MSKSILYACTCSLKKENGGLRVKLKMTNLLIDIFDIYLMGLGLFYVYVSKKKGEGRTFYLARLENPYSDQFTTWKQNSNMTLPLQIKKRNRVLNMFQSEWTVRP